MKYDKVAEKSIPPQKWQFEELKNEEGKVVSGIGYAKNSKEKYPLEGLPQYFFILYNKNRIYFHLRANPYILRIYSGKRKDNIEETYSELLLFTSWRDEKDTFHNDDQEFREKIRMMFKKEDEDLTEKEEEFKDVKRKGSEVERNRNKIYPHSERIKELRALLEEGDFLSSNLGDRLDPAAEQEDADDKENQEGFGEMDDENLPETSNSKRKGKNHSSKEEKTIYYYI